MGAAFVSSFADTAVHRGAEKKAAQRVRPSSGPARVATAGPVGDASVALCSICGLEAYSSISTSNQAMDEGGGVVIRRAFHCQFDDMRAEAGRGQSPESGKSGL